MKLPKPKKPPPPPNKLDTMTDALRNNAMRRAGGITRADTNVTGGGAGGGNTFIPGAGRGQKTILGG